jgi:multiple sugar transport system substrate-binding protein
MNSQRRSATALALLTVLTVVAVGLSACGRDAGGAQDDAKPVDAGKATGAISVWAMGTEGEKLSTLAADFMKENPDAKVTVTAVPWDAAHQKISGAIAGKQTPDVSMIGTTWMGEFAKTGALDPTPSLIDKSAFFPGAWDTTVVDGTAYAVPWYVETRCLFYRKDLAATAGFPDGPKTWDDLKAMAKAMQTSAGAKWGITMMPGGTGSWQTFLPFAWSNGAEIVKDGKFTFDTPETTEALKFYQSFFTEKLAPTDLPPQGALEQGFINGSIGSFVSGPWHVGLLNEQGGAGFAGKFGVVQLPVKKTATSFIGGSNMAVFKDSKNRDAAWRFVSWLSRPQTQISWYRLVKDLPAVQKSWDDATMTADPLLSVFGKQLKTAKAPPSYPTWEQVAAGLDDEIERAATAGADAGAALKAAQDKANAIGTGS